MIMGYSLLNGKDNPVYKTEVFHPSYDKVQLQNLTLDELFVDEDITIPCAIDKPTGWNYRTVLNAAFKENLEGGSVQANNFQIERVRFQRREVDEAEWQDIGELPYNPEEQLLYELLDKNVQNDFEYQYSILPMTATVLGSRVVSDEIKVDFEGIFLSDKNSNYRLFYNIEEEVIEHNVSNSILEPLNSQYPIVTEGSLDYRSGGVQAMFVSAESAKDNNQKISIKAEKLGREKLMKFIKNKKPKVLRQDNGETILVRIVGSPQEEHIKEAKGLAYVSFNYVEIGGMDSDTLKSNNILFEIEEEF